MKYIIVFKQHWHENQYCLCKICGPKITTVTVILKGTQYICMGRSTSIQLPLVIGKVSGTCLGMTHMKLFLAPVVRVVTWSPQDWHWEDDAPSGLKKPLAHGRQPLAVVSHSVPPGQSSK